MDENIDREAAYRLYLSGKNVSQRNRNGTGHGQLTAQPVETKQVPAQQWFTLFEVANQFVECHKRPRDHDHAMALFSESLNLATNSLQPGGTGHPDGILSAWRLILFVTEQPT